MNITVTTAPVDGGLEAKAHAISSISFDRLWRAITDYERYPEFMPRTSAGRIESRDGDSLVFATELDFGLKKIRYRLRMTLDRAAGRIDWTMIDGALTRNDGSWELERLPHGQLGITYTSIVITGYWVPKKIEKALITKSLPDVIRRAIDWAKQLPEEALV